MTSNRAAAGLCCLSALVAATGCAVSEPLVRNVQLAAPTAATAPSAATPPRSHRSDPSARTDLAARTTAPRLPTPAVAPAAFGQPIRSGPERATASTPAEPAPPQLPGGEPAASAPLNMPQLPTATEVPEPVVDAQYAEPMVIDLANALAMGGANDLQVRIARERVVEAHANWQAARTAWLPTLRLGVGWNKHDGRIQETSGNVIEVSRNSLFVGGGAGLNWMPLTGGAGGPSRLMINLSVADALFGPLAAERMVASASCGRQTAFNDALRDIALAYFDLVESTGRLANAQQGRQSAEEMLRITRDFRQAGTGSQAEVDRALAEAGRWRIRADDAGREIAVRGATLARLLRVDPRRPLMPVDEQVLPVSLVDESRSVDELVATATACRPEIHDWSNRAAASCQRYRQELWRPWLPNVQVGSSYGLFGGGPGSQIVGNADRIDLDLLAVWEVQNLGYGNQAARRVQSSQWRQASMRAQWFREQVAAQVVASLENVRSFSRQLETARSAAQSAVDSYQRNLDRVRESEALPIELLQAIRARIDALDDYVQAVANYNRAQAQLLYAVGKPVAMGN